MNKLTLQFYVSKILTAYEAVMILVRNYLNNRKYFLMKNEQAKQTLSFRLAHTHLSLDWRTAYSMSSQICYLVALSLYSCLEDK